MRIGADECPRTSTAAGACSCTESAVQMRANENAGKAYHRLQTHAGPRRIPLSFFVFSLERRSFNSNYEPVSGKRCRTSDVTQAGISAFLLPKREMNHIISAETHNRGFVDLEGDLLRSSLRLAQGRLAECRTLQNVMRCQSCEPCAADRARVLIPFSAASHGPCTPDTWAKP
jgi:hypothetical protein